MNEQIMNLLDALTGIKLLPRRAFEQDVIYGYVTADQLAHIVNQLTHELSARGYDVHCCEWPGETVLLALHEAQPLALRLTSSAGERYNLYALSRPRTAQALWQWAQAMLRHDARRRRGPKG